MKKVILHLCADTGSDSKFYQNDPEYEVILVGYDKFMAKSKLTEIPLDECGLVLYADGYC